MQPNQPDAGGEPREPGDRLQEATSDYLTELLDRRIVGERVNEALLEASRVCPPVELAPLIASASTRLNDMLSGAIRDGLATTPLPSLPVDVASGIGANFITQPLGQPIRRATITVEVIGIAVGVLLVQPQLVAACVQGIAHQVASKALSNAIDGLLTRLSEPMHQAAVDQLTTAHDPISLAARDSGPADLMPGEGVVTISRDTRELLERAVGLTERSSIPSTDGPATDSQADAIGNAADLDDPPATGFSAMG